MEQIRNTFRDYFKNWEIELPKRIEYYGTIEKAGWHIIYILEERNEYEAVLHISASHRMTNTRNFTIRGNGKTESIVSHESGYSYNPNIQGDEEKQQQLFYARNRKVSAIQRKLGIGRNLRTRNFISCKKYHKTKTFTTTIEIYHPNYLSEIRYNQLSFKSLSHFYHYWKLLFSNEIGRAEELIIANEFEIDFIKGVIKKKSIFNVFTKKTNNQNLDWEENKLRILLWGSILKFTQNETLKKEILKYYEHKFIFKNNHEYWGTRNNVLGRILTQTCYDVYYLNWKGSR